MRKTGKFFKNVLATIFGFLRKMFWYSQGVRKTRTTQTEILYEQLGWETPSPFFWHCYHHAFGMLLKLDWILKGFFLNIYKRVNYNYSNQPKAIKYENKIEPSKHEILSKHIKNNTVEKNYFIRTMQFVFLGSL